MQTRMFYWVTGDGTIVRAAGQISKASAERDPLFASPFNRTDIVGRNLFSFIEGMEVRHLYAMFHERVLKDDRHITFDYRCDSPDIRRDMRMSLSRDGNLVRYESVVLSETTRAVPIPHPSAGAQVFVAVCSICKKYQYPQGCDAWKELDLILCEPELPEHFNFSHGLCPECFKRCMDQISG